MKRVHISEREKNLSKLNLKCTENISQKGPSANKLYHGVIVLLEYIDLFYKNR